MKFYIRADGGEGIGMGHIMRTMVLAEEIKNKYIVEYIVENKKEYKPAINLLKKSGFNVNLVGDFIKSVQAGQNEYKLANGQATELGEPHMKILILDKYTLPKSELNYYKKHFDFIIALDDNGLYNLNDVDMILNQNLYAAPWMYIENDTERKSGTSGFQNLNTSKTPNGTSMPKSYKSIKTPKSLMLGGEFCLLRDEFRKAKPIKINKRVKNIMITLGGSDDSNITESIVRKLKDRNYILNVVVGQAFKFEEQVKRLEGNNVILHKGKSISKLISQNDLIICGSGSTIYEAFSMGIPAIALTLAENQINLSQFIDDNNLAKVVSLIDDDVYLDKVESFIDDYDYKTRIEYSKKCLMTVNKDGVKNVCSKIYAEFLK